MDYLKDHLSLFSRLAIAMKSLEYPDLVDARFTAYCGPFCTKILIDKIAELGHEEEVQEYIYGRNETVSPKLS